MDQVVDVVQALRVCWRHGNVVYLSGNGGARVRRLADRRSSLRVLGDGSQTEPYLRVSDLIAAMRFIVAHDTERRNVYNIGPEGACVAFIAEKTVARALPGTTVAYTGADRGWIGDVPRFCYSTERFGQLGWWPGLTSDEAVLGAIDEIADSFFSV